MAKRVFIMHRWGAETTSDWYPWLRDQLKKEGFSTTLVELPETDDPQPEKWLAALEKAVGKPDESTYLVGHSLGAQTILKYLERGNKVGGVVLVAPLPRQTNKDSESPEFRPMSDRWLPKEPNWKSIAKNAGKVFVIFSDNDPFVPLSDSKVFQTKLKARVIIENGKGHFGDVPPEVLQLPSAYNAVIELSNSTEMKLSE